jgi:hypothetical protein
MSILAWAKPFFTPKTNGDLKMADIKDIVTDELVKTALRSDAVTLAVKTQIKTTLDAEIDAAVDAGLTDILGEEAPQG